jgi:pyruvate formate lyase activating enzyme
MKTAKYWRQGTEGKVQCGLCPHGCTVGEGKTGICRIRGVAGGELRALGYGLVSSANLDPIEKKPLYHFHPGADIFSIGGWGCNFGCGFCQNWTISQQVLAGGRRCGPEEVARLAGADGSIGVAYTYNEPLVGIEFVADCARLVRAAGRVNVLVTNGYVNPEPAAELLPWIDAMNVDIKSMDDAFYRQQCHGTLPPVLDFCVQAMRAGCHVEVTNLLIPGLNDSDAGIAALADWVRGNLGEKAPLHLSAYRPQYKTRIPATPASTVRRAFDICRQRLPYVYMGNVPTDLGQNTECPQCQTVLIRRHGYTTAVAGVEDGQCRSCGRPVDGVLSDATAG